MLNQCQFIGNVAADPEIKTFGNGGRVANLRLGVNERWKDRDGNKKERVEWVSIAIFSDGLVGVAERFLRKGSRIMVIGKMQTRKWTDQSGQDRYSTEIVLQGPQAQLVMLDGKRDGQGGGQETTTTYYGKQTGGTDAPIEPQRGSFADALDDDIPFISCRGVW